MIFVFTLLTMISPTLLPLAESAVQKPMSLCRDYLTGVRQQRLVAQPEGNRVRTLRFSNGLEVVLVKDMGAQRSVASLSVGVGTLKDPRGEPGFFRALGRSLAATPEFRDLDAKVIVDATTTAISISVPSSGLKAAIARVADRVFRGGVEDLNPVSPENLEPLLNRMMEKPELQSRWLRRVVRDPGHAFSRSPFQRDSAYPNVAAEDLARALSEYFFPGNMKLVLMGAHSFAELEKIARDHFVRDDHRLPLTLSFSALRTQYAPAEQLVEWQTVGDSDVYMMDAVMSLEPTLANDWPRHSLAAIADYLNDSERSDLSRTLQDTGWVEGFNVSVAATQYQRDFEIHVRLTPRGYAHFQDVLHIIDQALRSLADAGSFAVYSVERQAQREAQYLANRLEATAANANRISEGLWSYRRQDILEQMQLTPLPDLSAVKDAVQKLLESSRRQIFLGSPNKTATQTRLTPVFPIFYGMSVLPLPSVEMTSSYRKYESGRALFLYPERQPGEFGGSDGHQPIQIESVYRVFIQPSEISERAIAQFGAFYYAHLLRDVPGVSFSYNGAGQFILRVEGPVKSVADEALKAALAVLRGDQNFLSDADLAAQIEAFAQHSPVPQADVVAWLRSTLMPDYFREFMVEVIEGASLETMATGPGMDSTWGLFLSSMLASSVKTGTQTLVVSNRDPSIKFYRRVSGATSSVLIFVPAKSKEGLESLALRFVGMFGSDPSRNFNLEARWIQRGDRTGFELSLQTTQNPEQVGEEIHAWLTSEAKMPTDRGTVYILGSSQLLRRTAR